ncbi:asparagine synthase-related protein [Microseira wollei]|uniref:asparagine synthase (glutamine-hydrolyzing) n=1 Tax=Microseira wollei NIES-4236 TaxID=2530354 RepID=A0AAV3WPW6_9CYAN|nr:asparagine synthase-related protein [Microseira wollei]GET44184.1 asparagine synthase, glutamine-hydrolyzing [Microseira wollei NIES-4236]
MWVSGCWKQSEIICVYEGAARLAILGECLEETQVVAELFRSFVSHKNYNKLRKLAGNYNIIVQDETGIKVFTYLAGLRRVFYSTHESVVFFSSSSIVLKQLVKASLNPSWLAANMMCDTMPEILQCSSPFQNVEVMPAGDFLQISSEQVRCRQYWTPSRSFENIAEASKELRKQLWISVERRVRACNDVTSDLSGGPDSTSLALIAAKILAKRGLSLKTVTLEGEGASSDDINWVKSITALHPELVHSIISNSHLADFTVDIGQFPLTNEPSGLESIIPRFKHWWNYVKLQKSELHLSGSGGDCVLQAHESYLIDLIIRKKI